MVNGTLFLPGGADIGQGGGPIFWNNEKSAFSANAQSWFASVVLDGDLGPLRLAQHN